MALFGIKIYVNRTIRGVLGLLVSKKTLTQVFNRSKDGEKPTAVHHATSRKGFKML